MAAEDTDEDEDIEAPVPTPGQVMDAVDLLLMFTGTHEDTEDTQDELQRRNPRGRCLQSACKQTSPTSLVGNEFVVCRGPFLFGNNFRGLFSYMRAAILFSEHLRFANTMPHKLVGCRDNM